jgi:diadenosine tetraphosphate (Ap4A) HIT family hydrolase
MTQPKYIQRVETARQGTNPSVVCKVPSGWVFMAGMQFLRGYCIFQADPIVESLNSLNQRDRARYLMDMVVIGDAILEVTRAYRINYAVMGNTEPVLHAHIVPRYLDEPAELRAGLPWSYPQIVMDQHPFEPNRDRDLMDQISCAIQKRNMEQS